MDYRCAGWMSKENREREKAEMREGKVFDVLPFASQRWP